MTLHTDLPLTPNVEAALSELQHMIAARYPDATYTIQEGFDPPGIYLLVTVDVPDTDEVFDVVVDRLIDLQVEKGLPVHVIPIRPIARVIAELREQEAHAQRLLSLTG